MRPKLKEFDPIRASCRYTVNNLESECNNQEKQVQYYSMFNSVVSMVLCEVEGLPSLALFGPS
jgi:hypothetical protein